MQYQKATSIRNRTLEILRLSSSISVRNEENTILLMLCIDQWYDHGVRWRDMGEYEVGYRYVTFAVMEDARNLTNHSSSDESKFRSQA